MLKNFKPLKGLCTYIHTSYMKAEQPTQYIMKYNTMTMADSSIG